MRTGEQMTRVPQYQTADLGTFSTPMMYRTMNEAYGTKAPQVAANCEGGIK